MDFYNMVRISISFSLFAIKPLIECSTAWEKVGPKAGRAVNTGMDHP